MILRALVEIWPNETGIFIDRLPGAYTSGIDEPSALDALPDTVEQHIFWLMSHGGFQMPGDRMEIEIAERLFSIDGRFGPLFDADRIEPGSDGIELALQVAELGRRDLIDLYRSVSAMRRDATPADGSWSIARHLRRVAELDLFYVSPFASDPLPELPDDPVQALQTSSAFSRQAIELATESHGSEVVERDGEEWTLAKVLRRMSGHIREHEPLVRRIGRG